MARFVVLASCAAVGSVAAGALLALLVPVTMGRVSESAATTMVLGCIIVAVALGAFATRAVRHPIRPFITPKEPGRNASFENSV